MISKWIQLRDTTSTTHISFKISPMSLSSTNKYHPHQYQTLEVGSPPPWLILIKQNQSIP